MSIEIWLKQAECDLKSAKNSFNSKDYYVSALLSQQAVEKAEPKEFRENKNEAGVVQEAVKNGVKIV